MTSVDIFAWPGCDGLLSSSPFCLKVFYASQYKGLDTRLIITSRIPSWAKRGKLPVAKVNDSSLEDSTEILRALDVASPMKRLYPEDPYLKQQAILLEDWSDESLSVNLTYNRWCVSENFTKFADQVFKGLPSVVKKVLQFKLQRDVELYLKRHGIAELPDTVRKQRFEEHVLCIDSRLSKNQFLVCDSPTAADFAIFSVLQSIKAGHYKELENAFTVVKNIESWMQRMTSAING